jgi:A/G-specific adenine glycosylase
MIMPPRNEIDAFRRKVWLFYKRHGQRFPFRRTPDPYRIAVSEFMLQQTQIARVLPKYDAWITRWPNWEALAGASPRELLAAWSGLGYNRRALHLGNLARAVVDQYGGQLPTDPEILETLPGVGRYTARAVIIFAFNKPLVAIDTNIRRVIMHEFHLPPATSDDDLERLARRLVPKRRSRDWHNALMDYARMTLPRRAASLRAEKRPSAFEGSSRQLRGRIVKRLLRIHRMTLEHLAAELDRAEDEVRQAALALQKDGLVRVGRRFVTLV